MKPENTPEIKSDEGKTKDLSADSSEKPDQKDSGTTPEKVESSDNDQEKEEIKQKSKKVLVAMTGRMDSAVAAFLLKKQGLDVTGISVNFFNPEDALYSKKRFYAGFEGELIDAKDGGPYMANILPHCHLEEIDRVKKVCDQLEIGFYAINAFDEYREMVFGNVLANRLEGKHFFPCLHCSSLLINILVQKAELLGADYIGTGHYAKVHFHEQTKLYNLLGANDREMDQSNQLVLLGQKQLQKLLLPIGDLRRIEVEKIAKSSGWKLVDMMPRKKVCFMDSPEIVNLIERTTAPSLRKSGHFILFKDDSHVGEHQGIHRFQLGDDDFASSSGNTIPANYEVVFIRPGNANVTVAPRDKCRYRKIAIREFKVKEGFDLARPFQAFAKIGDNNEHWSGIVVPKNNDRALVELRDEQMGVLKDGDQITLFDRQSSEGSYVLGMGVVDHLDELYAYGMLKNQEEFESTGDEEEIDIKKIENPEKFEF